MVVVSVPVMVVVAVHVVVVVVVVFRLVPKHIRLAPPGQHLRQRRPRYREQAHQESQRDEGDKTYPRLRAVQVRGGRDLEEGGEVAECAVRHHQQDHDEPRSRLAEIPEDDAQPPTEDQNRGHDVDAQQQPTVHLLHEARPSVSHQARAVASGGLVVTHRPARDLAKPRVPALGHLLVTFGAVLVYGLPATQ